MKPSKALDLKRNAVRAVTRRFGTTNARGFDSVLHRTDRDGSDLELLVEALLGTTLFDLCGLQVQLEELPGMPANVLTPGDFSPKLRNRALTEALPI